MKEENVRVAFCIKVTDSSARDEARGVLKVPLTFSQSLIKELQKRPEMTADVSQALWQAPISWWRVPKVHGTWSEKTKHVKHQMPKWSQRETHTARHLSPFRGSCRGVAGFIMDVMERRAEVRKQSSFWHLAQQAALLLRAKLVLADTSYT